MVKKKAGKKKAGKKKIKKGKKKGKKKRIRKINYSIILSIIIVAASLIFLIINFETISGRKIVAEVNNHTITYHELEKRYNALPDYYKKSITEKDVLNEMINEVLLVDEAIKNNITVTDYDVDVALNKSLNSSNMTLLQLKRKLINSGFYLNDLKELFKKQLMINKLINMTFPDSSINVSEADMIDLSNKTGLTKENAKKVLISEYRKNLVKKYINDLRNNSIIKIYLK